MGNIKRELNDLINEFRIADFFEKIDFHFSQYNIEISDLTLLNSLRKEFVYGKTNFDYFDKLKVFTQSNISVKPNSTITQDTVFEYTEEKLTSSIVENCKIDSIEIQLANDSSFIDFRFSASEFKNNIEYKDKINSFIFKNIPHQLELLELFINEKISQSKLSSIIKFYFTNNGLFFNAAISLPPLKSKNNLFEKFCIWLNFRHFDGMKGVDFGNIEISFSPLKETTYNLYSKFLDENIKSAFLDLQPKICELLPSLLTEILSFEVTNIVFLAIEEFDYGAEKLYNASYLINPIK
jgi:hypothetical protein